MSDYSKLFRRSQALILAIAIMLTAIGPVWWTGVSADDKIPETITAGEIVANNYELTKAEEVIIASGYLIGDAYEFYRPTSDDNLISVDIDNKIITAKDFIDDEGNTWYPVKASVVVGDEVKEIVELNDCKGTYTYAGDAFFVKVDYEFTVSIDEATQQILLDAPKAFKEALANMNAIKAADTNLSALLLAYEGGHIQDIIEGFEISGYPIKFTTAEALAAAQALGEEYDAEGKFHIVKLVEDYTNATDKVQWLEDNGEDVEDTLNTTIANISALLADGIFGEFVIEYMIMGYDPAMYTALKAFISSSSTWLEAVEPVAEDEWLINEADYLNAVVAPDGLDLMVASVTDTTDIATIKNPLIAATTTIQFNMSMSDVTVKVILKTVDSLNAITDYDVNTIKITLADNSTRSDILAAVEASGIVADSIEEWDGVYAAEHFGDAYSDLPDTLTEDVEYTIVYSPVTYEVNYKYADTIKVLPYGYRIILDVHAEALKAYDYYINSDYYAQGAAYIVTGDAVITREEGKSYVQSNLKDVVNGCYFANGSKSSLILGSDAVVIGEKEINVRYPDNNTGIVSVAGNTLTANAYPSSYKNLTWMPYTYTVVGNTSTAYKFGDGATTATLPAGDYDRIEVIYRLVLTDITDAEILEIINLPNILAEDAKAQKKALDALAGYTDTIGQLDRTKLGALNGAIDVTEGISDEIKAYFMAIVSSIIDNCLEGSQLKIYNILKTYTDANNGGLSYYYKNSAKIINEINVLSGYLSDMLKDDEKMEALEILVVAAGFPEYKEKIVTVEDAMASVKNSLTAPDSHIDVDSADLSNLVDALLKDGSTSSFDAVSDPALWLDSEKFVINADNKVSVSASVQVAGGKPVAIDPITFGKYDALTDADIQKILDAIDEAIAALGIDAKYYTNNYDADYFKSFVGKKASELESSYKYTWTPITYTVDVEGAETQQITINNLIITLPASTDAAERYEYIIGGVKYSSGSYKFTLEQIDTLFVDNALKIERIVIDVQEDDLKNLVNTLNDEVGNDAIRFVLIKNNGEYSIVMKVNAAATSQLKSAAMNTVMGLVNSGYSYIGVDNNGLLYIDEETDSLAISMQAIVDAVMNSGFGTDTLIDVMNASGVIKNMTLAGNVISNAAPGALGGKLIQTTMQLGSSLADSYDVDFYITLGSAPAALTEIRNLFADQLANYIRVVCEDGQAKIELTLPQKAYEAYLAVLLVTGEIDITDINAVNGEIAIGFVKDLIDPLFAEDMTAQTFENTLNMLGFDIDLSKYDSAYQAIRDLYNDFEFTYDESSLTAAGNIPMATIIDKLNLGDLGKMIVEYENGLDIELNISLENLGDQFNGLYLDINAEGVTNKVGLSKDIAAKVASLTGKAFIVLTDDVEGDLVFNQSAILDLNGQTVTGDIIANGQVIILDTSLDTEAPGIVEGDVTGNAIIVSGTYYDDVTAFIKEGYVQNEDGAVVNEIYTIKEDAYGNVTIELNAGVLAMDQIPDIKVLLVDILADLIFNGYTANKLYIDGNKIYEITFDDFVGLYAGTNRVETVVNKIVEMIDSKELTKIINTVLADITDFATMHGLILNDQPILSYEMITGAWGIAVEHVADGDYLTGSLVSTDEKVGSINILIVGTEADKAIVAGMVEALAETTDIDVSVDLDHGFDEEDNKNLVLDWAAEGSLIVDFTADSDYAITLCLMIASGLDASENAQLVAAIREYYETESMYALQQAFNNLTTAQAIKSLKNLTRGDDVNEIIVELGLDDCISDGVAELESYFDSVAKLAAAVLRRTSVTGGDRKLGSYMDPDGTYGFFREGLFKSIYRELFRGYGITLNVEIYDIEVVFNLFGDPIEIPDIQEIEVSTGDKIVGAYVDSINQIIYIDAHYMGITAQELLAAITVYAENADSITLEIEDTADDAIVRNGLLLFVTATSPDMECTAIYTIVIVGDVNGNGRIESGDAVVISQFLVGMADLTPEQSLAADINRSGRTDIGDASIIANKLIFWDEYVSAFED